MVRPDILDEVADILRQSKRSKEPFGGVRLIMFGDLSQLPPVVTEDDFVDKYYDSRFFFSSKALRASGYSVITFNKVFRQKDSKMISVLEDIRCGNISEDTRQVLESRIKIPDNMDNTVFICSTNKEVSDINNSNLSKIEGDVFKFKASVDGERPQAPCEDELMVKIGAKVIITRNGSGYVNGSVGVITDIDDDVIYVKLNDGSEVDIIREKWEKIKYRQVDGDMEKIVCGSIYQFPIRLGYAITSHKSQGMTLDSVYLDMGKAFESGQVYTAISRCKSLEGLYLKQIPDNDSIVLSDKVQEFMEKVEEMNGDIPPEKISDIGKCMIKKKQDLFNFEEFGL